MTARQAINRAAFVPLELAGRIGRPEGRYLVREGEAERVLIVQEIGAPRSERGRRRSRPVEPAEPAPVAVTLITVTGEPLADESEVSTWLKQVMGDRERRAEEVRAATRIVNRALNALRAGARDPLIHE